MDKIEVLAAILVWLLVIGAALMRVPGGSMRSLIAPWLALTAVTVAVELIVLNLVLFLLYFAGGSTATWVGIVLSVVIVAATPVAWAVVLRRRAHAAAVRG